MAQRQPLTCAIIGLSWITSDPAVPSTRGGRSPLPGTHASAIARIPDLKVTAICDVSPDAIAAFHKQWDDHWPGMRDHADAFELIREESPDILAVVTPDHLHRDIVVAAAEKGIPAIMCEKPLATSVEDADAMIAVCDRHGTTIQIDHTRRWDPFFHQAKLLIDEGRIGEVISVTGTLHGPRAMLYRNGTHVLDLMHAYAGAPPTAVSARLEPGFDDFTAYRGDGGHEPGSEPAASAYIEYANGARGHYNGLKGEVNLIEWDVIGTGGRIRIGTNHAELYVQHPDIGLAQVPFPASTFMNGGIQGAWEDLIAAVRNPDHQVRSTARDARATVATIDAILRSHQEQGKLVSLRQAVPRDNPSSAR